MWATHRLLEYYEMACFIGKIIEEETGTDPPPANLRIEGPNVFVLFGRPSIAHMYLIAAAAIEQSARILCDLGFARVRAVYEAHRGLFRSLRESRNDFEHFGERMPGGNQQRLHANPQGSFVFGFQAGTLVIGGTRLDLGATTRQTLLAAVNEMLLAVEHDARNWVGGRVRPGQPE
jgi:hypothetical protein